MSPLSGRPFICFENVRGIMDSQILESGNPWPWARQCESAASRVMGDRPKKGNSTVAGALTKASGLMLNKRSFITPKELSQGSTRRPADDRKRIIF
jgi:hypothetical protein